MCPGSQKQPESVLTLATALPSACRWKVLPGGQSCLAGPSWVQIPTDRHPTTAWKRERTLQVVKSMNWPLPAAPLAGKGCPLKAWADSSSRACVVLAAGKPTLLRDPPPFWKNLEDMNYFWSLGSPALRSAHLELSSQAVPLPNHCGMERKWVLQPGFRWQKQQGVSGTPVAQWTLPSAL